MKRFGKFIILALLGFALGAGVAYVQQMKSAKDAATEAAATTTATTTTETPSIDMAKIQSAAVPSPDAEMALNTAAQDTPAATTSTDNAPVVAGSSVGGPFSLTDQNGNAVTEASWPGKFKLVFFGFTHCPDICPTTLQKLTASLDGLSAEELAKLQPLFITTDPARDDANAMKEYLKSFHSSIVGLTGTEEQIKDAENTYKVFASSAPVEVHTDKPADGAAADSNSMAGHDMAGMDHMNHDGASTSSGMEHSAYVFLMSPDDKLLEIFKTEDTAEAITAKIKADVANAPAPAATSATEAADKPGDDKDGANETTVPGDMIPQKPEIPAEITPAHPADSAVTPDAPSSTPEAPANDNSAAPEDESAMPPAPAAQ